MDFNDTPEEAKFRKEAFELFENLLFKGVFRVNEL